MIFFILKFDIASILFRAFNFMDIVFASSYYHFEKQIITLVPIFYGNSREKVLWKLLLLLFPYMNIKHSLSLSLFFYLIWKSITPSFENLSPQLPRSTPRPAPSATEPHIPLWLRSCTSNRPAFSRLQSGNISSRGRAVSNPLPQTMALVFIRLP